MATRRPDPHRFVYDPDWPGCCRRCRLIRRHEVHDEEKVAAFERDQEYHRKQVAQGQAWHRHRTGDDD